MTNEEYYGILGLIRKDQEPDSFDGNIILAEMFFLVLFPLMMMLMDIVTHNNLQMGGILFKAFFAGLVTTLFTALILRFVDDEDDVDLVKLLNECRHLSVEEVEKKEEFKHLFE